MKSKAVRIPHAALAYLEPIAKQRDLTVGELIAEWVEERKTEEFWARVRESVAATLAKHGVALDDDEIAWMNAPMGPIGPQRVLDEDEVAWMNAPMGPTTPEERT